MLDSIMRIIWGFIKLYLYNLFLFMNINGEFGVLLTVDIFFFLLNLSLVECCWCEQLFFRVLWARLIRFFVQISSYSMFFTDEAQSERKIRNFNEISIPFGRQFLYLYRVTKLPGEKEREHESRHRKIYPLRSRRFFLTRGLILAMSFNAILMKYFSWWWWKWRQQNEKFTGTLEYQDNSRSL